MTSRAIQLGAQGAPFPTPRCAVMISGASYQCYSCPTTRKPGEPTDHFVRCNWYSQGAAANSTICGAEFPPFNTAHNKWGVCPGYTLYPNASNWWQVDVTAQR